jgi:excisionase family DNA binding protein
MSVERHYRVSEAAELLGLKESTLRKWFLLRKCGYRKIGAAVRVPESEIKRLLNGNYVPARPEAR